MTAVPRLGDDLVLKGTKGLTFVMVAFGPNWRRLQFARFDQPQHELRKRGERWAVGKQSPRNHIYVSVRCEASTVWGRSIRFLRKH